MDQVEYESFRNHAPAQYMRRLLYGAVASGLILAGCGDANNSSADSATTVETTVTSDMTIPVVSSTASTELLPAVTSESSTTTQPDTTTTSVKPVSSTAESVPAEDCGLRSVDIGKNFSADNSEKIAKDLDLLSRLHTSSNLDLSDIWTAGSIIHQSREDPLFAEAINKANTTIESGQVLSTEQFLSLPVEQPVMCSDERITRDDLRAQLYYTVTISDYVISKMTGHVADVSMNALREMTDKIRQEYNELLN